MVPLRGGRLLLPALVAGLVLAACGGGGKADEGAGRAAVTVETFMFDPDPLVVKPGTTITWTNRDATVHTVTTGRQANPTGRVDAKLAPSGGHFSTTYDKPGTYRYFCSRHSGPGMRAVVVVG